MYDHATTCAFENSHLSVKEGEKCFTKCTFEKLGIFDEMNGLNVEHLVKMRTNSGASEDLARPKAEKCAVKRGESENNCEWASQIYACLHAEKSL